MNRPRISALLMALPSFLANDQVSERELAPHSASPRLSLPRLLLRRVSRSTALVPDEVDPARDHDPATQAPPRRGQHLPYHPVDTYSPQERGVLERGYYRGRCRAECLGEQVLADRGEHPERQQPFPVPVLDRHPSRGGDRGREHGHQADRPEN